ncbi:MAG TPA: hypothetical protein PLZ51_06630, partial [Aggregatilineales bacterium]|nr:hypothetical protein [Aggregatilineales bacterium]
MDVKWRFGTTALIWVLATIMTVVAFVSANSGNLEDWIMVVPLVVAMFATVTIWESSKGDSSKSDEKSSSGKKGDSTAYTMALLMEMMDEDEREEFKYDLKNRILSGEAV